MKNFEFKLIQKENIDQVIQVAINSFGSGVETLISKRNMWGYYATDGERIVGAIILEKGGKDEGFVQWIFVDPKAQGNKIASRLMDVGTRALNADGRTKQFALVRDDNTASWNLFLKAEYQVLPLIHTLFKYSKKSFFKRAGYAMITGYSTWVKDNNSKQTTPYPKFPIIRALIMALTLGISMSLFGLKGIEFLFLSLLTVIGITLLRIFVSYPIARAYGKVKFLPSQGGVFLSFILGITFQIWFPVFGFFAPKEELWKSHEFKKNLGLQSFATLLLMQGTFIASSFIFNDVFNQGMNFILAYVLVIQTIPFFPLDGTDSGKIIRYNKFLYIISLVGSILSIIFFF